jgi:protein SCO1/2
MPYRTIGALLLLFALAGPSQADAQTKPRPISEDVGLDQRLDAQVSLDLMFRDEQGRDVRLGDLFQGKPVVLTLVYYRCPMLCTEVLNAFLRSSQAMPLRMDADYEVISVSIDPHETPKMAKAKKERYASSYRRPGANEGWHFLTGDEAEIAELAKTVGYRYKYDPLSDQYAHPSGLILLTPEGRISRYFYGVEYDPGDLRLGLVESSEGKIGTLVDQVLLLCFHYDPATGKYGFIVDGALRIAGIATAVALGGFLFVMWRRELRLAATVKAAHAANPPAPKPQEA